MNDANQDQPKTDIIEHNNVNKKSKRTLIIATIVLLLVLGVGGVYYWQRTKVVRANSEIEIISDKNKALAKEITDLQSQNIKNEAMIKSHNLTPIGVDDVSPVTNNAMQTDLTVSLIGARYVNPDGTVTSGASWYGVRLTLTNSSSRRIDLAVKSFSLKDADGNTYSIAGFSGATTLPDGWGTGTLQDQTIDADSFITGNLIFKMPNKIPSNFTLVNGSKTYPISATQ